MFVNRKDRLKIGKKIHIKGSKKAFINWRSKHNEHKQVKEREALEMFESNKKFDKNNSLMDVQDNEASTSEIGNQNKPYSIHVAIPGSIMNNAQTPELRAYLAGQIARTCCIFCVEEIIIFDETARMTQNQIDAYYSNQWLRNGNTHPSDQNVECNFHMARILEYLECPQYLRKALFPMQRALKFAGILNPLDGMHHLRSTNLDIPYREGVVLSKPIKEGHGSLCDVGLEKELELDGDVLPPMTRVTVKITKLPQNAKRYRGTIISPKKVKKEAGIYWGYNVRLAKSLSDVFSKNYDVMIGTSDKGTPINSIELPKKVKKILIVFGGLDGLESAVDSDYEISANDPSELFPYYVNALPDQGSRIIRTEEAIPITLTLIKYLLG